MSTNGQMIEFDVNGRQARGYLVSPAGEGRHPALLVIQEWWGLNDHIKDLVNRFAAEGFVVLAPDLYDGKLTRDPEEAGKLMQGLDQNRALETLNAGVAFLETHEGVDQARIGVTGFCMGGTFALLLAIHNKNIKASAPFYGDVPSEEVLGGLSAPVLFIGAENDPWINREKMERLANALTKFGKEGEVKIYPDAGHAFFNDTRPDAYNRKAAEDAWNRVLRFLKEKLG